MGNLRSVEKAIEYLGFNCRVANNIQGASKLIIPGVGAFGAAMERLKPIEDEIKTFAASGSPLLGICLGQQLLFDVSEEHGETEGLGLIAGRVRYFPPDMGLKVPHIGWSAIAYKIEGGLAKDGHDGEQVFFVHSLYTDCFETQDVAATADYGLTFAAAVQKENVWGTQFHPEKSSSVGLRILKNFLEC